MSRAVPFRALALVLALAGCNAATLSQQQSPAYQARPELQEPVIRASDAMLSEEAIRVLLSTRVAIPGRAKLAVAGLAGRSVSTAEHSWYAAPEFLQRRREHLETFVASLRETGRFEEIAHLPALMMERRPSYQRLREAAALMQANLLLVYEVQTQLVYDPRFLRRDQVKTHGAIDVLLVDVRTGAVPYADTFEATHVELQREGDADGFETRKRADHEASRKVVGLAAAGVRDFLRGLPAQPASPRG